MSLRTHAVVVQPDQWAGAPAELARLLAPITGSDVAPLTEALARGPMTVEADLTAADARALADRLSSMGVPAEIQPATGPEKGAVPGGLMVDQRRVTDEVPRTRRSTMMGHKPMVTGEPPEADEAEDDGGWGAVFPELAPRLPAPAKAPVLPQVAPSLDDLEAQPRKRRRKSNTEPLGQLARAQLTPPLRENVQREPESPQQQVEEPEAPAPAPPTPPTSARPAAKAPIKPTGFDASKLAALMPEDEKDRPPHKPTGFDPRPEHHPPFAKLFAILAPGAGLVFNGEDDEAISLALRFWMVAPWVRSVKQAADQAEKIRTFWAPRPPDGSGVRAIKFVGAWWLCVALVSTSLAWGIPAVFGLLTRPSTPEDTITAEEIGSAHSSAVTGVLGARVKALDALQAASKDLIPEPTYTLTDDERAERLFAIGYGECRRHTFPMCEAMMKRVLQLRPAYPPAFKLQAWASLSMGGRREKMPDVGIVPSLSDLELNEFREQMILDGEHVPPPPKPSPENPEDGTIVERAPAGADAGDSDAGNTP